MQTNIDTYICMYQEDTRPQTNICHICINFGQNTECCPVQATKRVHVGHQSYSWAVNWSHRCHRHVRQHHKYTHTDTLACCGLTDVGRWLFVVCSSINHVNYVIANNLPAFSHTQTHTHTRSPFPYTHTHIKYSILTWGYATGSLFSISRSPFVVLHSPLSFQLTDSWQLIRICNASLICLLSCGSTIFAVGLNQQTNCAFT